VKNKIKLEREKDNMWVACERKKKKKKEGEGEKNSDYN